MATAAMTERQVSSVLSCSPGKLTLTKVVLDNSDDDNTADDIGDGEGDWTWMRANSDGINARHLRIRIDTAFGRWEVSSGSHTSLF